MSPGGAAFAVPEALALVLAIALPLERTAPRLRLLRPFLLSAGVGVLATAAAGVGVAARVAAAAALFAGAALVGPAGRRIAHHAPPAPGAAAGAVRRGALLPVAAALAILVLAVVLGAGLAPGREPVAIGLATALVGLFAASLRAPEPARLLLLFVPSAGTTLLASSLSAPPAALMVVPAMLPLAALGAGSAILARTASLPPEAP